MSLALFRFWRAPAVQALLLQAAAFPLTLGALFLMARLGAAPGFITAAFLQGAFACVLTWWRRLAPWWLAIQLLFPLALLQTQALSLPPAVFMGAFLFLLLVFWSNFRTQVPYYPSGRRVWEEVLKLLPQGRPVRAVDIGSGLGGLVLELARQRPDSRFDGIELAPLPWLASRARAAFQRQKNAHFIRGDYEKLDFSQYDLVFAYLSPAAMSALWNKASREMRKGSILLSYEFLITEKAPEIIIVPKGPGPSLYLWHF